MSKPNVPAGEPVVLVPMNVQIGGCTVPAVDEAGNELDMECVRLTLDTAIGTIHVAVPPDNALQICDAIRQVIQPKDQPRPPRLQVAGAQALRELNGSRIH